MAVKRHGKPTLLFFLVMVIRRVPKQQQQQKNHLPIIILSKKKKKKKRIELEIFHRPKAAAKNEQQQQPLLTTSLPPDAHHLNVNENQHCLWVMMSCTGAASIDIQLTVVGLLVFFENLLLLGLLHDGSQHRVTLNWIFPLPPLFAPPLKNLKTLLRT